MLEAGGRCVADGVAEFDEELAALAIAPPPSAAAPMALAVTSFDLVFRMMSPLGGVSGRLEHARRTYDSRQSRVGTTSEPP
jgi:hypothetical protein